MRLVRKLTLLAVSATATAAMGGPSALAQVGEPELHNQAPRLLTAQEVHAATDVACPTVTPTPPPVVSPTVTAGGCRLHLSGQSFAIAAHLTAGGTEVAITTCNVEFDLRLDSAGEGWISHQELTQPAGGSGCVRRVCGQVSPPTSEGRAWVLYLEETEVAGQGPRESAVINLCTEALDGTGINHCEITVPLSQPAPHRYRLNLSDVPGHGAAFPHCEFSGTFDSEAVLGTTGEGQLEQNVEIRHT